MKRERIVIGGASGFWGEASHATRQLLEANTLDFLVYDYLAEITLSIMARARAKDPELGFAGDFVTAALAPNLSEIARQKIKVISNAGGVNPHACAQAVRHLIAEKGLSLKVGVVTGDDLLPRVEEFAQGQTLEMFSDAPFPDPQSVLSINAYLGAFPIAQALDDGADIIITGRCVDSAVTLGACIHSFGWTESDFDLLASGSLAGHILECGPQATGGNFTDWRDAGDISEIGYPIATVNKTGSFALSKPEGTSGVVSVNTVCEQMLYEIGDPQAYMLADVNCDFSNVTIEQIGNDRVHVKGAKGYAPSGQYKTSLTYMDGFRAGQTLTFNGFEAREKAQSFADAVIKLVRKLLRSMNAPDFEEVDQEVFGGSVQGDNSGYEEILLKVAVRHQDAKAVALFLKELTGLALSTPAGMSLFTGGGRPRPSPVIRLFSFLVPAQELEIEIKTGDKVQGFQTRMPIGSKTNIERPFLPELAFTEEPLILVPLIKLALARSGDKGDKANIGIIAREPEYLPWIWHSVSEEVVAGHFAKFLKGSIERFYLPGSHSINYLLHDVLGGGGVVSLRNDAQGKGYGQMLLALNVEIPQSMAKKLEAMEQVR